MSRRRRIHVPLADDTRPRPGTNKTGCECRNHMGTPKTQHRTKEAALAWLVQSRRSGGAYQCPTSDRWHATSQTSPDLTWSAS